MIYQTPATLEGAPHGRRLRSHPGHEPRIHGPGGAGRGGCSWILL